MNTRNIFPARPLWRTWVLEIRRKITITDSCSRLGLNKIVLLISNADRVKAHAFCESLALIIRSKITITDSCSRFGLNKIILLISNADRGQAHAFCQNLAAEIQGKDLIGIKPNPEFCFAISVGFAQATKDSSLETLLETAESSSNPFYKFKVC